MQNYKRADYFAGLNGGYIQNFRIFFPEDENSPFLIKQ